MAVVQASFFPQLKPDFITQWARSSGVFLNPIIFSEGEVKHMLNTEIQGDLKHLTLSGLFRKSTFNFFCL